MSEVQSRTSCEDLIKMKDFEIECIRKDLINRDKYIDRLEKAYCKEIERLNNIINELEKWLEEQHQFIIEIPAFTKEISTEHKTMEICYENALDKLQELKGVDKK